MSLKVCLLQASLEDVFLLASQNSLSICRSLGFHLTFPCHFIDDSEESLFFPFHSSSSTPSPRTCPGCTELVDLAGCVVQLCALTPP